MLPELDLQLRRERGQRHAHLQVRDPGVRERLELVGRAWRNTAIDERQRGGTIRSQGSGSSMSPLTQTRRQGMSVP